MAVGIGTPPNGCKLTLERTTGSAFWKRYAVIAYWFAGFLSEATFFYTHKRENPEAKSMSFHQRMGVLDDHEGEKGRNWNLNYGGIRAKWVDSNFPLLLILSGLERQQLGNSGDLVGERPLHTWTTHNHSTHGLKIMYLELRTNNFRD